MGYSGSSTSQNRQGPSYDLDGGRVSPGPLQLIPNFYQGIFARGVLVDCERRPAFEISNQMGQRPFRLHRKLGTLNRAVWEGDLSVSTFYMFSFGWPVWSKNIEIKMADDFVNTIYRKKVVRESYQRRFWHRDAPYLSVKGIEVKPVKRLCYKRKTNASISNGRSVGAFTSIFDIAYRRGQRNLGLAGVGCNYVRKMRGKRYAGLPATTAYIPYRAPRRYCSQPFKQFRWVGRPEPLVGISLACEIRHTYSPY